jgi:predicted patatin/cPLA2 family phospholipase
MIFWLQVVGNISSKDTLLDAVAASSYLPFWSGPSAVTSIDGLQAAVYDGGFSYPLPCPPGAVKPGSS